MLFNNRFKYDPVKDKLGEGAYGSVFKAFDTLLEREVALKFVTQNKHSDKYSLVKEIQRVIGFNHPNLLKYFDASVMQTVNAIGEAEQIQVGIIEYANSGSLKELLQTKPSLETKKQLILGVLKGLHYLHLKGLLHRDIKPGNILLHNDGFSITPKISDFGISKDIRAEATATASFVGTFEYMSPEQFGSSAQDKVGIQTDLWAIGALVYEFFTDDLPFGARKNNFSEAQIISNILKGVLPAGLSGVPSPFREVVERCLVRNLEDRAKDAGELIALIVGESNAENLQNEIANAVAADSQKTEIESEALRQKLASIANLGKDELQSVIHEHRIEVADVKNLQTPTNITADLPEIGPAEKAFNNKDYSSAKTIYLDLLQNLKGQHSFEPYIKDKIKQCNRNILLDRMVELGADHADTAFFKAAFGASEEVSQGTEQKKGDDAFYALLDAETLFDRGDFEKAKYVYENMLAQYPDGVHSQKAKLKLAQCNRKIFEQRMRELGLEP